MNVSSEDIRRIYRSRTVLLELMKTQGYNTKNYENFSVNNVEAMIGNNQLDMLLDDTNNNKKIYVKYYINKVIKPQNIYNIIEDLFYLENILEKKDDLMIVIKDQPNETLIQTIKDIWMNEKIYISLINIKRLQFNILEHTLVPKHSILNEKEEEEFRKQYNILNNNQIPTISYFDPVSLVLGIRPDNIVKIERYSRTSIYSLYYRICKI